MLSLDARPGQREFSGQLFIHGVKVGKLVRLHSKGLKIISAKVNYSDAKIIELENDEIELRPAEEKKLTADQLEEIKKRWGETCDTVVVLEFIGTINPTDMHGLYECHYNENGEQKIMLATQFESHFAREVFPCVDEPAAKAQFSLQINTATQCQVLSNMPIETEDDGHVTFQTTPKMSPYLLAFVVGDLHKKTARTKRGVEVNVYATPTQSPDSLDFALDTAVRAIDFYEDYFGVDYPLPKSDHVALPDFSAGAMENWGLVTYRETALLAGKTAGLSTKQYIATVIAHELSHQWFGNLVTMKWWNDLWLNESFASLMEHVCSDALYPDWNMWLTYETNEVVSAMRRDALPGVQPVQQDVHHPDEISTLFDPAIVYAKGERLLKMLRAHIGEKAFRAGLQSYFRKFAYQNTKADDLWNCLNKASDQDIASLMTPWLTQPGYPVVSASLSDDKITLHQERFLSTGEKTDTTLWPIPLFSSDKNAPKLMTNEKISFKYFDLKNFQLNMDETTHYIVNYDDTLRNQLNSRFADMAETDRLKLLNEMTLLTRAGRMSTADTIDTLRAVDGETSWAVWDAISLLIADLKMFVEEDEKSEAELKKLVGNIARPSFKKLGVKPRKNDDDNATKLRPTIISHMIYSEDKTALAACLEEFDKHRHNLTGITGDLRPVILGTAVKFGDDETFAYLVDIYKSTNDADLKQDVCVGLTASRSQEQIDRLIRQLALTDVVRPQDLFYWFVYLLGNRHARTKIWQWCRDNWSWIEKTYKGDMSYDRFPRYAGSRLRTAGELHEFDEFFASMRSELALARSIDVGHVDIATRVEWIERDKNAVFEKL